MSLRGTRTSDYHFELPPEAIAQTPAAVRDESRLLVVHRGTGQLEHRRFSDLVSYIPPGDALVVNETRVFPARLRGQKATGAAAEILLLNPEPGTDGLWRALVRPGGKLKPGRTVEIGAELSVEIVESTPTGERLVRLHTPMPVADALDRYGEVPLPPYVERSATAEDRERYQTVFARERGSVAAPTAGLHFTPELLERIRASGVRVIPLLLHVGVGTFRPVESEDPAAHPMHSEWYRVSQEAAAALNDVRSAGGAIWAIGTTVARTLETVASPDGAIVPGEGWTNIFIRPPYRFRGVDRLLTNFHLPRSTLLMLVAAFAGHDLTMGAYAEAVEHGYRFYSYGDAMLLV